MFEQQRGRRQAQLIDDPLTRKGCQLWLERVLGFYGEDGGVDVEIIDGQVILNEKTVDYLYGDFTPTEIKYVPGSRPVLEAWIRSIWRTRCGRGSRWPRHWPSIHRRRSFYDCSRPPRPMTSSPERREATTASSPMGSCSAASVPSSLLREGFASIAAKKDRICTSWRSIRSRLPDNG